MWRTDVLGKPGEGRFLGFNIKTCSIRGSYSAFIQFVLFFFIHEKNCQCRGPAETINSWLNEVINEFLYFFPLCGWHSLFNIIQVMAFFCLQVGLNTGSLYERDEMSTVMKCISKCPFMWFLPFLLWGAVAEIWGAVAERLVRGSAGSKIPHTTPADGWLCFHLLTSGQNSNAA